MSFAHKTNRTRRLPQLVLFICLTVWYFGSRALAATAASGLAFRFRLVTIQSLLEACFHLFLLVVGCRSLDVIARRGAALSDLTALPNRPTKGREWLVGAVLGWAIVVIAILPMVVLGRVYAVISIDASGFRNAGFALAVLLVTTLTHEIAFRGYPFRCLTEALGESTAVLLMVLGAGISAWHHAWVPGPAILASMLLTFLLSLSWLRTRAVWLSWGLHFSLAASGCVLFGLQIGVGNSFSSLVRSRLYGPDWMTGGDFGPAAAWFTLAVLAGSVVVLFRVTREYSWHYTYSEIVAGGYEVTVAPSAAHIALEQQERAQAPALVQILATTPTTFSAGRPPVGAAAFAKGDETD